MDMLRIVEEYESKFLPEFDNHGNLILYKEDIDAVSHPVQLLMEKMHRIASIGYSWPVGTKEYLRMESKLRVCTDCGVIHRQVPRYCKECGGIMIQWDQLQRPHSRL